MYQKKNLEKYNLETEKLQTQKRIQWNEEYMEQQKLNPVHTQTGYRKIQIQQEKNIRSSKRKQYTPEHIAKTTDKSLN